MPNTTRLRVAVLLFAVALALLCAPATALAQEAGPYAVLYSNGTLQFQEQADSLLQEAEVAAVYNGFEVPAEQSGEEEQPIASAAPEDGIADTVESGGSDSDGGSDDGSDDDVTGGGEDPGEVDPQPAQPAVVPWSAKAGSIKRVVFATRVTPVSTAAWFYGCTALARVSGMDKLDTSRTADMHAMFAYCKKLASIDLTGLDTGKVADFSFLFAGCSKLASADLSGLDTSEALDMGYLFQGCKALTTAKLSKLTNPQVRTMSSMFSGCSSLKTLKLTGFSTAQVTDMNRMFSGCSSLKTLKLTGFSTAQVTDMNRMFSGCSSLATLDVSSFDTAAVTSMTGMFEGCSSLPAVDVSKFDTSGATDMASMFAGCASLASFTGGSWATGAVRDMTSMFEGCRSLVRVNLSKQDWSRVFSLDRMFEGCHRLLVARLGGSTPELRYMRRLFRNCLLLRSVLFGSVSTGAVLSMSSAFSYCPSLRIVTLAKDFGFNGAKAARLSGSALPGGTWMASLTGKTYGGGSIPNKTAQSYARVVLSKPAAGQRYVAGSGNARAVYKVRDAKKRTVTYLMPLGALAATTATVPATVKLHDGKSYRVMGVGEKAFSGYAKLKKVTVKTPTLLSAASSLSGSAVTAVKVSVSGSKADKRACLSAYRKLFAKSRSGKKVSVS